MVDQHLREAERQWKASYTEEAATIYARHLARVIGLDEAIDTIWRDIQEVDEADPAWFCNRVALTLEDPAIRKSRIYGEYFLVSQEWERGYAIFWKDGGTETDYEAIRVVPNLTLESPFFRGRPLLSARVVVQRTEIPPRMWSRAAIRRALRATGYSESTATTTAIIGRYGIQNLGYAKSNWLLNHASRLLETVVDPAETYTAAILSEWETTNVWALIKKGPKPDVNFIAGYFLRNITNTPAMIAKRKDQTFEHLFLESAKKYLDGFSTKRH